MPTAVDFDDAADLFDSAAGKIAGALVPVDGTVLDDVVRGGQVRSLVDAGLAVSSANVFVAFGRLKAAAEEARRRADVCRDYAAALGRYQADWVRYRDSLLSDDPLPSPDRPDKPYDWVSV